ncbi:MAG: hypothetical protein ACK5LV_03335 [Lachnospirales bacterium]
MDLIYNVNKLFSNKPNIVKVSNFYFERHLCSATKEEIKIDLNFSILNQNTKEICVYGYCENCNTIFYNKDYK